MLLNNSDFNEGKSVIELLVKYQKLDFLKFIENFILKSDIDNNSQSKYTFSYSLYLILYQHLSMLSFDRIEKLINYIISMYNHECEDLSDDCQNKLIVLFEQTVKHCDFDKLKITTKHEIIDLILDINFFKIVIELLPYIKPIINENFKSYLENLIVLKFLGANSINVFDNLSPYSSKMSSVISSYKLYILIIPSIFDKFGAIFRIQ